MATRRRYRVRRFKRSGRSGRRKGGARRLQRFIKRVIRRNTEVKYAIAANLNSAPAEQIQILNINPDIPQGPGKAQRIGNRIRYKNMQLRVAVWQNSGVNAFDFMTRAHRLIVVQQRVSWSSPPIALDVFDTNDWLSTIKGQSCRVMFDKFYTMTPNQDANQLGTVTQKKVFKLNFRINNNVTYHDAATTFPGDFKDLYYIINVSDSYPTGAALSYTNNIDWLSRISYLDM